MNEERDLGRRYLIVGVAFVASILISVVQTEPADPHDVARELEISPAGSIDWNGRPIAVAFLERVSYNATKDATLAGALVCSHKPCGPLFWIRGEDFGRGPFLLRSDAPQLTREVIPPPATPPPAPSDPTNPTAPPTTPTPSRSDASSYHAMNFAIAEPFDVDPGLLPAALASAIRVAPLFLFVLALDAAWWPRGLAVAGVVGGWAIAFKEREETWGLIGYTLFFGILFLAAVIALANAAARRRHVHPQALAVLALVLSFFIAIAAIKPFFPGFGGE